MKRKMILFTSLTAVVTFSVATVIVLGHKQSVLSKGVESFHMVLDSSVEPVEKDGGYFHEVDIKNNKIDIIGYHEENNAFGSISREKCGDFTYNGMIYNRSVINGFDSLTVDFTGGTLYYVFTNFLMEDMSFYGHLTLTSNQPVAAPEGKAYFIIYNKSETPVTINSIDIKYDCDGSIDRDMIFNKDSQKGGARSLSKRSDFLDSYVELENNPLIRPSALNFKMNGIEAQIIALAGVGRPMNLSVWRSSRLNFANRRAENAAIMNGTRQMSIVATGSCDSGVPSGLSA